MTGGMVTAKCGSTTYPGVGHFAAVEGVNAIEIGNDRGLPTGLNYQTPAYLGSIRST